jgi:hypothetical protein
MPTGSQEKAYRRFPALGTSEAEVVEGLVLGDIRPYSCLPAQKYYQHRAQLKFYSFCITSRDIYFLFLETVKRFCE